jgi:hypothetical protein
LNRRRAAHPIVAAVWALGSTAGLTWLAALWVARVHDDQMRALAVERQRQAVRARPEPQTVADLLLSCRTGRRIGDAERDVVVGALHTHYAAGRLNAAELDERLLAALAARTVEDLSRTVDGLPDERTGR